MLFPNAEKFSRIKLFERKITPGIPETVPMEARSQNPKRMHAPGIWCLFSVLASQQANCKVRLAIRLLLHSLHPIPYSMFTSSDLRERRCKAKTETVGYIFDRNQSSFVPVLLMPRSYRSAYGFWLAVESATDQRCRLLGSLPTLDSAAKIRQFCIKRPY